MRHQDFQQGVRSNKGVVFCYQTGIHGPSKAKSLWNSLSSSFMLVYLSKGSERGVLGFPLLRDLSAFRT